MTHTRVFPLRELWQGETCAYQVGRVDMLFVRLGNEVRVDVDDD